jgi:hypothetical protein
MGRVRAAALPIIRPELVELYLAHRTAQGMGTDHKVRWGARALLAVVPDLEEFSTLPLDRQLAFNHETHRFVSWLSVTRHLRPGADYLDEALRRSSGVLTEDPHLVVQYSTALAVVRHGS